MSTWVIVLTSAAVGAIASAIINLIGQALERSSRRQEIAVTKAIELTNASREHLQTLADRSGNKITSPPIAVTTGGFYRVLLHLMKHDKLPKDFTDG